MGRGYGYDAGNFGTGFMQGYSFVKENQRADADQARKEVLQGREDVAHQKKLDLDKIQAVRYAVAATPPDQDPWTSLTPEQQALVQDDPGVQALIQSPELRAQRAQNLALIEQGFDEYHTALTNPQAQEAQKLQSDVVGLQANVDQYPGLAKLSGSDQRLAGMQQEAGAQQGQVQANTKGGLAKMIQGAQGEWGAQINKGADRFGADINQVAAQFPGLKAPDGSPVGSKQIESIHPSEDGKSLAFGLKITTVARDAQGNVITDSNGQPQVIQYSAPATEGRNGDPNAPVMFHPISTLTRDLQMRQRLLTIADARAVELGSDTPIKQQQAIELVAANKGSEMKLKEYENQLAMIKSKFDNGLITEKEMKLQKQKAADKITEINEQSKRDIIKVEAEGKNSARVAGIHAGAKVDVANISAANKKAIADAKAQMGGGDAKTNYPQIKASLTAKLLANGEQIQGPGGKMLSPSDPNYNDAVTSYVNDLVESWRPKGGVSTAPAPAPKAAAAPKTAKGSGVDLNQFWKK